MRNLLCKCFSQMRYQRLIFFDSDDRPECQKFPRENALAGADLKYGVARAHTGRMGKRARGPRVFQKMLAQSGSTSFRHGKCSTCSNCCNGTTFQFKKHKKKKKKKKTQNKK